MYGFQPGPTGLTYIGGGLGELCAAALGGWVGNTVYHNVSLLQRFLQLFDVKLKRASWNS
jgi:hypothetical protein